LRRGLSAVAISCQMGPAAEGRGWKEAAPMADIADLEGRLAAALDRMGRARDRLRDELAAARAPSVQPEAETRDGGGEDDDGLSALRAELGRHAEAAGAARAEVARLTEALAAEREALGGLTARAEADREALESLRSQVEALRARDRLETLQAGAAAENGAARIARLEQSVQQLQEVNAQLRQNNAALRKAVEAQMPDGSLVDSGLRAELEALEAARTADRAEIDSILAALQPLLEETADA